MRALFLETGMQLDLAEARELEMQVKMRKAPRHDVHMRAGFDLAGERRKAGKEAADEILQPRARIPSVRRRNHEHAIGVEVPLRRLEKKTGIGDVLDALAAHNQVVAAEALGYAGLEIGGKKMAIAFGLAF